MTNFKEFLKKNRLLESSAAVGAYSSKTKTADLPIFRVHFGKHSEEPGLKNEQIEESLTPPSGGIMKQIGRHSAYDQDMIHDKHEAKVHKSIATYSSSSRAINHGLINKKLSPSDTEHVHAIDGHLANHELKTGFHVFSGIHKAPSEHFHGGAKTATVHMPAYTSTSTDYKIAVSFGRADAASKTTKPEHHGLTAGSKDHEGFKVYRHVLKLHLSPGTHAASVREQSKHHEEHEVLVGRGHNVEIHHKPTIDHANEAVVWHARTISRDPHSLK